MYEAHFGLNANPFSSSPLPEFVYESREHREALAHFQYALANREAFVLLTGEVGTGKTTAIQALRRLLPDGTPVAVVTHTTLEPRELLDEIALRFGLEPATGESKPMLMRRMETFLEDHRRGGGQALVVLDEAHLLSPSLLEEVRLLSNLESIHGGKLIQICLVGQPELESHLHQPQLRQLRQRISVRYALKPLNREETRGYIHHRLAAAGASDPAAIFPPEAAGAIHALSQGIPREINVLAGQALLNAYLEEAPIVSRNHVFSAKSDYGFEGIVTGAAALSPEGAPSPPPPRTLPVAPPRTSAPRSVPPPPSEPTRTAPPAGDVPRPARRPIPLPPASLRPPPRVEPSSAAPRPAPAPAAPRARLSAGPGLAAAPRRKSRRTVWIAGLVVLVVLVGAGAIWLRGGEPKPEADLEIASLPGGNPGGTGPEASESARTGAGMNPVIDTTAGVSLPPAAVAAGYPAAEAESSGVAAPSAMSAAPDTQGAAAAPSQDLSPPAAAGGDGESGLLAVQVASFQTRRRAEAVRDAVSRSTGLPAAVLPAEVDGAVWYRILMGAFDSEAAARSAAEPLLRARTIRVVVVRQIPGSWEPFLSGTGPAPPG